MFDEWFGIRWFGPFGHHLRCFGFLQLPVHSEVPRGPLQGTGFGRL